jgi:hypothetical protein
MILFLLIQASLSCRSVESVIPLINLTILSPFSCNFCLSSDTFFDIDVFYYLRHGQLDKFLSGFDTRQKRRLFFSPSFLTGCGAYPVSSSVGAGVTFCEGLIAGA